MRVAILSDTHFGDDDSVLVTYNLGNPIPGNGMESLIEALKPGVDFLVLAGDILDFSIAPYNKAYACARYFFERIKRENPAMEIIYLAGNHDGDIWHLIQHERHVIHKLYQQRKLPEEFEHSVAGVLDMRSASPAMGLTLNGVTPRGDGAEKYGGMFLDKITVPDTRFRFAYPNLYIVTDKETVLVTHGHYLMTYFSFLGEMAAKMAPGVLSPSDRMSIEQLVELNFPLTQLACTGVGQAGILTDKLIRPIQLDALAPPCGMIRQYIRRLQNALVNRIAGGCFSWLGCQIIGGIIRFKAVSGIEKLKNDRYRNDFFTDSEVRERCHRFTRSCLMEIDSLNGSGPFSVPGTAIPYPDRIIFGHTHQPIPWADPEPPVTDVLSTRGWRSIPLHNTGGWLRDSKSGFCGAEIFFYEDGKGFFSKSVS